MIWQGVNRNLLKLPGGKPKFAQITWGEICHEGPKQNKNKNTRMRTKKKEIYKVENRK